MFHGLRVLTYPHFFIHKLRDLFSVRSFDQLPIIHKFISSEITCVFVNLEGFEGVEVDVKACVSFERSGKDKVA